jgi:hypothetical protein
MGDDGHERNERNASQERNECNASKESGSSVDERLVRIERKLDAVLAMLEPVHSHAEWVDGLRSRLHSIGLMRNTPRPLAISQETQETQATR